MTFYRLKADWQPEHRKEPIKAGTLLFPWRASGRTSVEAGKIGVSERPDGWGQYLMVPGDMVEANPQPLWTEFEQLITLYLVGADEPPNIVEGTDESLSADLDRFVHMSSLIKHGLGSVMGGRIKLPSMRMNTFFQHYGQIATAALNKTQGGKLTGEAILLIQSSSWAGTLPRTASFKICDHEIVTGAGARPERGWHPARCSKCGLDLSVDSSD